MKAKQPGTAGKQARQPAACAQGSCMSLSSSATLQRQGLNHLTVCLKAMSLPKTRIAYDAMADAQGEELTKAAHVHYQYAADTWAVLWISGVKQSLVCIYKL